MEIFVDYLIENKRKCKQSNSAVAELAVTLSAALLLLPLVSLVLFILFLLTCTVIVLINCHTIIKI